MKQSRRIVRMLCLVGLVLAVTACAVATQTTYTDPFAYCSAVGTMDTPDARYTGAKMPDDVAQGLQVALGLPTGTPPPPIAENSYWRCMDSKVYACSVGANLPCLEKANTDTTPTEGMISYCKENPTAEFIPAVATGRDTVYEWSCNNGTPEAGKQILTADARGFLSDFWYEIQPSGQ